MADLKARGIYTIARIVTFKDNILANARPDLAIIDTRTGKPWIDNEKLAWVDPFREEVWAYNIALGQEAIRRGFDEVQFDYVRFPTDGKLRGPDTPGPTTRDAAAHHRRLPGQGAAASSAPPGPSWPPTCSATPRSTRTTPTSASASRSSRRTWTTSARWSIPPATTRASRLRQPVWRRQGRPRERASDPQARERHGGPGAALAAGLQGLRVRQADLRRVRGPGADPRRRGGGGSGWMLWNPRNDYTADRAALEGALVPKKARSSVACWPLARRP